MTDSSILKRTNQWWKLVSMILGVVLSIIIPLASLLSNADKIIVAILVAIGGVFSLIGLFIGCFCARCPNCGAKWIWMAISRNASSSVHWMARLLSLEECPRCGYRGDNHRSDSSRIQGSVAIYNIRCPSCGKIKPNPGPGRYRCGV